MLRSLGPVLLACFTASTIACSGKIGGLGESEPLDPSDPNRPNNPNDPINPIDPNAPFLASKTLSRRLSQNELNATLFDLLGDDTQPARTFLTEDELAPFDNDYTLQIASSALIDSMDALGADVASRALADPVQRARIVPCVPAGAGDAVCFRSFVETFGRRALRRPLSTEEVDRYLELQAYSVEVNEHVPTDFYTGVELVVRAFLLDPEFFHRVEAGTPSGEAGVLKLDGYAIASRMSYLLWGTMPDDTLFADAAAGLLDSAEGRRTAAERMMSDERAKAQMFRFHGMWLGYRAIPHNAQLVAAFNRETTSLIDRVVFQNKESYLELFRSRQTFVDDELADHYGYERPENGEGWVVPADSERAGILSHGSVLAAFSKFTDTSPTQRGILVRSRLMCLPIDRPPPNVDTDRPPPAMGDAVCKKDRYAAHTTIQSCAQCHSQMDPIGFGLERYDIAGRFRMHDDGAPNCAIEGVGELPGHGTFSGPRDLSEKLIAGHYVENCLTEQFYTYAIGRQLDASEGSQVQAMVQLLADNNFRLDRMIVEFIASEPFALMREGDE
jgi:hypothetical protein